MEQPAARALREAGEETGLERLKIAAYLGSRRYAFDAPVPTRIIERHYCHLICEQGTPQSWVAWE